jgi:hypothetical protein
MTELDRRLWDGLRTDDASKHQTMMFMRRVEIMPGNKSNSASQGCKQPPQSKGGEKDGQFTDT